MITWLWFDHGKARESAEFYAATFPNSHVGKTSASPTDTPSGAEGQEFIVEFTVCGRNFMGLNGGPKFVANGKSQLYDPRGRPGRDRSPVERRGQRWRPGEHVRLVQGPLGVSWQITPRALLAATTDPDRAAAKRPMNAMVTMRKIDIASIEAACAGEPGR